MNPLDGTSNMVNSMRGWAATPFNSTMSLSQWALFTGLIIVLVIFWIMVLRDLKEALIG